MSCSDAREERLVVGPEGDGDVEGGGEGLLGSGVLQGGVREERREGDRRREGHERPFEGCDLERDLQV